MRIRDFMTAQPAGVAHDADLQTVAREMIAHDCGAIPVIENEQVIGIVTDRDIAVRAVAEGRDPTRTTAGEIMTKGVYCVREDDDESEAVRMMEQHQIRRLLVLDANGRVCGIISLGDLALAEPKQEIPGEVLQEVSRHAA